MYHYVALFLCRFFWDRVCDACIILLGRAMVGTHCDFSQGADPLGQALDRCCLIAPPGGPHRPRTPAGVCTVTHRKQSLSQLGAVGTEALVGREGLRFEGWDRITC